jgi:hypothetical protein
MMTYVQLAWRSIPLTLRITGWQIIIVTVPALVDDAHKLTKVVKVGAGDTEYYE